MKRYRILKENEFVIPRFTLQSQSLQLKDGRISWTNFENASTPKHILGDQYESNLIAQTHFKKKCPITTKKND